MSSGSLDRYDFGDLLGVGTVGTIYAATDRQTGQQVAIKKLHPRVSRDPLIRARFKREMTILERLRHPNIVAYLDGGKDDDALFYVMELVNGGTVKSVLESGGPLPWTVMVDLAIQICSALQCAHNHGVVHRDLKPGNLFLNTNGELKLGDFGIARDLTREDLTEKGFTVGTHAYMAPEQIRGEQSVSAKADLYALGCCLFEMLTDRKPFSGENYAKLFDQHLKAEPPRIRSLAVELPELADIPEPIDNIISQLLEKDPQERPFNARFVQAVMLKLVTSKANSGNGQPQKTGELKTDSTDAEFSPVESQSRQHLINRIRNRNLRPVEPQADLSRLLIVFGLVVSVVAAVFAFRSLG